MWLGRKQITIFIQQLNIIIMNILEQLQSLKPLTQYEIYKTYLEHHHYSPEVELNEEDFFNDRYTPLEALRMAQYGNYSYLHLFVKVDGHGNLQSSSELSGLLSLQDIAADIEIYPHLYDSYIELEEEETNEDEE